MLQSTYHVRIGVALALLMTVGVSTAMWLVPTWRPTCQLARRWQAKLSSLDDHQVRGQLEKIAQLGEPGIDVVVRSLSSRRGAIAATARDILSEQFAQWQLQSTRQSTPHLAHLAGKLARQSSNLDQPGRRWSVDLATQMLVWPAEMPASARIELFKDCETILRTAGIHQVDATNLIVEARGDDRQQPLRGLTGDAREFGLSLDELPEIPGGDLPLDIANIPSALPRDEIRTATTRQTTPNWIDLPRDVVSSLDERVDGDQQEPASLDPPLAVRLPRGVQEQEPAGKPAMTGQRLYWRQLTSDAPSSNVGKSHDLRPFSDRELVDLLHNASATQSAAAREQLVRRGFSNTELRLAELLGAPDPQQRLRLTRLLPAARVEAERWWIWLSQDPDPQVRAATITILATTSDPELQKRLRRMQLEEDNEMVRRKIQQILHRRH